MTTKLLSLLLLFFSALAGSYSAIAETQSTDDLLPQAQFLFCAEDDSEEKKNEEVEEEEEPDCD